jgi:DNA-binding transcriptional MerR regulator
VIGSTHWPVVDHDSKMALFSARNTGYNLAGLADMNAPYQRNIVAAFSEEQVERLSGLTKAQLRYWDGTGFFRPKFADENRRFAHSRLYSFKDVVALRTLGVLRNKHGVALQHLRKVADKLSHLADDRWTKTTLYVLNKKVVFHEPGTGLPREVVSGQYVIHGILLGTMISDTKKVIEKMHRRDPKKIGRVERSKFVSRNAWVVGGTRIPTAAIRRFKEAGYTIEQIIAEYPDLKPRDIRAALLHEAQESSAA